MDSTGNEVYAYNPKNTTVQTATYRLQENEELIGIYGVKDKSQWFSSFGFIVKMKQIKTPTEAEDSASYFESKFLEFENKISGLMASISTNTDSIATNSVAIFGNTAGISTNSIAKLANIQSIIANSAAISAHALEIRSNSEGITDNTLSINSHSAAISENMTAFSLYSQNI